MFEAVYGWGDIDIRDFNVAFSLFGSKTSRLNEWFKGLLEVWTERRTIFEAVYGWGDIDIRDFRVAFSSFSYFSSPLRSSATTKRVFSLTGSLNFSLIFD